MNNIDEKIKSILSEEQIPPISFDYTIQRTINNLRNTKKSKIKNIKTYLATICCSFLLLTGVVFAKDIQKIIQEKFSSLGKGATTAIENGYIAISEMELVNQNMVITDVNNNKILDNINIKSKVESSIMTDNYLGIQLYFEFDKKINNYVDLGKIINGNIDYENSHKLEFKDMFVIDDQNNIIYVTPTGEQNCIEYYKEKNLDYNKYTKYKSGITTSWETINNESDDITQLTLECIISSNNLPKSKTLYICFSEFNLIPKLGNNNGIEVNLSSPNKFLFKIDLPENIYNRSDESYKVLSCDNKDFNIYEAKVTNTGFELELTVSNVEEPTYPEELLQRENEISNSSKEAISFSILKEDIIEHYGSEKYLELWEKYYEQLYLIKSNGINYYVPWLEQTEGCYVLTSDGKKYFTNRQNSFGGFSDKNTYKYHATFDMTQYDATDQITIIIDYKDKPVTIRLLK